MGSDRPAYLPCHSRANWSAQSHIFLSTSEHHLHKVLSCWAHPVDCSLTQSQLPCLAVSATQKTSTSLRLLGVCCASAATPQNLHLSMSTAWSGWGDSASFSTLLPLTNAVLLDGLCLMTKCVLWLCLAGYEDKPVHIECDERRLLLQPYNSPPVIDRMLNYPIDCQQPIETFRYSPKCAQP